MMLNSDFPKITLVVIGLVVPLMLAGFALPQRDAPPIRKEALITALGQLRKGDPQELIVKEVCARGVDFELTKEIKAELRRAGTGDELIVVVGNNFRGQSNRSSATNNAGSGRIIRLSSAQSGFTYRGIAFRSIPVGSFMMGSTKGEADEKPMHQVTISQPFYIGINEVTQEQWQGVMGSNRSYFKDCCPNCPVENVSWNDAQDFINRLNERGGFGFTYRLPTEAEWEYACRAGATGDYVANPGEVAWFLGNSGGRTHAVGRQPNAWGLTDMHGNVWEWCQDSYHDNYNGAPTNGSAWLSGGDQTLRILRGGSWLSDAGNLRSAFRFGSSPDNRLNYIGLRVVAVARVQ
jgi:Sulfatase-modifying factor enzyme 1